MDANNADLAMRLVAIALLISILSPSALAMPDDDDLEILRLKARFFASRMTKTLESTSLAFTSIADLIAGHKQPAEEILYGELRKLAKMMPAVRAMLILDPNGKLIVDSFTYPARVLDLSDRSYFVQSVRAPSGTVILSKSMIGRTSGTPFMPIAAPLRDATDELRGVIVAIVKPQHLVKPIDLCDTCVAAIINDHNGKRLFTTPFGTVIPQNVVVRIRENFDLNGSLRTEVNGMDTQLVWVRNKRQKLIYLIARAVPTS